MHISCSHNGPYTEAITLQDLVAMARRMRILVGATSFILVSIYLALKISFNASHVPADLPRTHGQRIQDLFTPIPHANTTIHPPLFTKGRFIVDSAGSRVKLASINWYGASDELFVVGGLEVRHRDEIAQTIRSMGFNSVRLPYSDQLVIENPQISGEHLAANPDLIGQSALSIFSAIVTSLTDAGLMVIPNDHITTARWCCDASLCDGTWHNDYLGPVCRVPLSERTWIDHLTTIMAPHINNPLVIGVDLRNEPRAVVDRYLWSSWAAAAERAAGALHSLNPDWLIIIEGISSANIISGARSRPVRLSVPNKLVYSAHVYGWSGWGTLRPYWNRDYTSFARDMHQHWAWLLEENVAPVWVGEFGAPAQDVGRGPNKGDVRYWRNLMRSLREWDTDWGYWALNARKPGGGQVEGYGLLEDDWKTVRWDYRLEDMRALI
jgi:endoglucanase